MAFFRQKFVRIGIAAVFVVLMIFGLAMMGSVLGAKPKDLPVGIAVLDQPAGLPDGGQLHLGGMLKEKIASNGQIPVKWKAYETEEALLAGLDGQEVYGAIVLPADFTAGVLSLQSPQPKPAVVKLYVNEGMNAQGVNAAKTILQQVAKNAGVELSRQVIEQIGQHSEQVPVGVLHALLTPFQTEEVSVHPVGVNNGGGNAPTMLTQIIWLGSMVLSVFLFLGSKAAGRDTGKWAVVAAQTGTGLVLTAAASGFLVWMASSWYGMEISDGSATWLFLWLSACAFFLLQSALFNWIGVPAVALLVLLLFFSMPVLNMAPEFMPQATQDWLYSWTPFRYVAGGLRQLMYFDPAEGMTSYYGVMLSIAGGSLAVLLASGFRKPRTVSASPKAVLASN